DIFDVSGAAASGTLIWQQIKRDAAGDSTKEQFGSTEEVTRQYNQSNQIRQVTGEFIGASKFQQLSYTWGADALLGERDDVDLGSKEIFNHDFLGRLSNWNVSQNQNTTEWRYHYDDLGNLRLRETVPSTFPSTTFEYTSNNQPLIPHAPKKVTI